MRRVVAIVVGVAALLGILFLARSLLTTNVVAQRETVKPPTVTSETNQALDGQRWTKEGQDARKSDSTSAESARPEEAAGKPGLVPTVSMEAFDKLFETAKPAIGKSEEQYLHEKFEQEVVDPSWAPNVEPEIQGHINNGPLNKVVEFARMECRATICEMRAYARTADANSMSVRAFQESLFTMPTQEWWKGYGLALPLAKFTVGPDGRVLMIGYLSKEPLDGAPK